MERGFGLSAPGSLPPSPRYEEFGPLSLMGQSMRRASSKPPDWCFPDGVVEVPDTADAGNQSAVADRKNEGKSPVAKGTRVVFRTLFELVATPLVLWGIIVVRRSNPLRSLMF